MRAIPGQEAVEIVEQCGLGAIQGRGRGCASSAIVADDESIVSVVALLPLDTDRIETSCVIDRWAGHGERRSAGCLARPSKNHVRTRRAGHVKQRYQ